MPKVIAQLIARIDTPLATSYTLLVGPDVLHDDLNPSIVETVVEGDLNPSPVHNRPPEYQR